MSISLRKDPGKRLGGWALILLPGAVTGASTVEIGRGATGEYLGPHGWQGGGHAFGPYTVETTAGGPALRIGPEIVNQIEAYEPLHMILPGLGLSQDLTWPEDILPAPGAMSGGGMGGTMSDQLATPLSQQSPSRVPPPAQPVTPTSLPSVPIPPSHDLGMSSGTQLGTLQPGKNIRGRLYVLLTLVVVALCAAAVWWLVFRPQDPRPFPTSPALAPFATPDPAPALACVRDDVVPALRAEIPDIGGLWNLVELCRGVDDQDLEVRVLERLVALEDARALRRFAQWYDLLISDSPGPFGPPDAANAAQYYKRAIAAGSTEAGADLSALCTHLRGAADGMSHAIVSIHCE